MKDKKIRKNKKYRFSLFFKFALLISISLVLVLLVTGFFLLSIHEKALLDEKMSANADLASYVADISAIHIDKFTYYALDDTTNKLQSVDGASGSIMSLLVYDNYLNLLNPLSARSVEEITIDKQYIYEKKVDCILNKNTEDEKKVGSIQIIFSLKSIYEKVEKMRLIFITATILSILIIDLIVAFFLYRLIISPLNQLRKGAKKISEKDFDITFKHTSDDEIGYLEKSFVKMSLELKRSFEYIESQNKEIEKYNKNLEGIVNERTEALKEANELMMNELKMAQRIQEAIIPKEMKITDKMNLSGMYVPMDNLGGDYYDVFKITDKKIGVVIADVCGHGVPAALITTMTKMSFFSNSKKGKSSREVVDLVNRELFEVIGNLEYLTAFYGIIDIDSGYFEYTNAGHNDILIIRKSGKIKKLAANSPIIGFVQEVDYKTDAVKIKSGDRIVLYTDGIIEMRNKNRDLFGMERFKNVLESINSLDANESVKIITDEVHNFRQDEKADDDMTLLLIDIVKEVGEIKVNFATTNNDTKKFLDSDNKNYKEYMQYENDYYKALELYNKKKYKESYEIVKVLVKKYRREEDIIKTNYLIGHICYQLNKYEEALKYWEDIAKYDPDNKELLHNIEAVRDLMD